MAPFKSHLGLSHKEGVSDYARARELYKYYQPSAETDAPAAEVVKDSSNLNISSNKISSPDTALTVFCQLTAWRMGTQRAMISLIDAETQYFVAESTRTVDLIDNDVHAPGDDLWLGCSSTAKAGRLCESTIAVAATNDKTYPHFIVNDLSKDERFNKLPFVTNSPFLRRYIGVPLITKRGIPIGSLFVVDDRPGNGLSRENLKFLGTMAKTVMRHLELVREVEEHRRGMKMSHGLSSLIEGRDELYEAIIEKSDAEDVDPVGKSSAGHSGSRKVSTKSNIIERSEISKNIPDSIDISENKEVNDKKPRNTLSQRVLKKSVSNQNQLRVSQVGPIEESRSVIALSLIPDNDAPLESNSEDISIQALFSRAAHLIQMAFELDGGTVFYDARTGSSETVCDRKSNDTPCQSRINSQFGSECSTSEYESEPTRKQKSKATDFSISEDIPLFERSSHPNPGDSIYLRSNTTMNKRVGILGFSASGFSSIRGDTFPGNQVFKPLRHKSLQSLLRQHPRGKLWAFNEDGTDSSFEQNSCPGGKNPDLFKKGVQARKRLHTNFFSRHFPGVRQLLFIPLWDAGRSRWFGGCFTWSKDPMRILSKQSELSFLTAFGNCVMAEWARIDTEIADRKKSDFIGSISHELRSPLHGILASVELLEEVLAGWEKQQVETIKSCGKTLLDTIDQILDFSKINHFDRQWRKSKRAKFRADLSVTLEQSDFPMLSIFRDIDISATCEEVIDSVYAGHVFQKKTAHSFDQIPDKQVNMGDAQKSLPFTEHVLTSQTLHGVDVVLDIDPKNYHVTTQPGALRRLIMNLLGNSLKYTSHGYVIIRLDCHDIEDFVTSGPNGTEEIVPRSMLTITVTDTGKGIAPEFLRNNLFIPFAQENILSSGTGLGLSIVRAIVSLLEGEISIDSEVGRGTQVKVSIPVLRRMPLNPVTPDEVVCSPFKQQQGIHEDVLDLRTRVNGHKVSLFGFNGSTEDSVLSEQSRVMKESVTNYLVNWYHMRVLPFEEEVDFIIANAADQSTISSLAREAVALHGNHPSIIVLCPQSSALNRIYTVDGTRCKVGYTARTIGPVKLARAIIQTIESAPASLTQKSEFQRLKMSNLDSAFQKFSAYGQGEVVKTAESTSSTSIKESPMAIDKQKSEKFDCSPLKHRIKSTLKNEKLTTSEKHDQLKSASLCPQFKVPSILIVDDNQINLRLLNTYLSRRTYPCIDTAENGLEAVCKFETFPGGYDIIFMDITMPVLDGFGATRQIRGIEKKMSLSAMKNVIKSSVETTLEQKRKTALIIAFTGRSSTEDQNEAVRCGINIFMTKPVPFREVGKICDNWIANQI